MNQALNRAAVQVCNEYEFVSFMGDDHVARTENWDGRLMEAARQSGSPGLSYGNDLLAGEALPTAVLMDSRLIRTLGYMTPPSLRHMFLDDFWLEIGTRLGRIRYLEDVVVEHMHFSAGKSVKDLTYESTNQNIKNFNDGLRYKLYLNLRAKADVEKIKRLSD